MQQLALVPQPTCRLLLPSASLARTDICDVVVHSLELIDSPPALANTTGLAAAAAEVARAAAAAAAGRTAGTAHGGVGTQKTAVDQPGLPSYQLPPAVQEQVVLVDSEEGLARMEQALFPDSSSDSSGGGSGGGGEPRGFGPPVSPFRLVVGLDCEWQPYSSRRGDPKTPVSLLQVGNLCGQVSRRLVHAVLANTVLAQRLHSAWGLLSTSCCLLSECINLSAYAGGHA